MSSPFHASVFTVQTAHHGAVPLVVIDGEPPRVIKEIVHLMATLATKGESLSKMRGIANVLALLHDFVVESYGNGPIEESRLPEVISGFLNARRNGSVKGLLNWLPVRRDTVERDRVYLRTYSDFCAEKYGHIRLVSAGEPTPLSKEGVSHREIMRRLSRRSGMLLAHLEDPARPKGITENNIAERQVQRRGSSRTFMTVTMVEDLISATPSASQQMVLIQAAFGGQRISEILNMWRCDILPGRCRPSLFPDDIASGIPLVVLAHPSQSTYTGDMKASQQDRLQHLAGLGRMPRHLMEGHPEEAGWKGMEFDNGAMLISQVFWASRSWAMAYYDLFRTLRDQVLPMVPDEVRRSHPYVVINDCPSRKEFGHPMKMSNIRKAFSRACDRIGVDEGRFHKGIHGLRHFYTSC